MIRIFDLYDYTQRKVVADQPNQHPVFKAELEENYALGVVSRRSSSHRGDDHGSATG